MKLPQILPAFMLLVITVPTLAGSNNGSFAIKGYNANKYSAFVTDIKAKNEARINQPSTF